MPISRQPLSASTGGTPLTLGSQFSKTTVHTTGTSASVYDEIYVYVYNSSATAYDVNVEFGDSGGSFPNNTVFTFSLTGKTNTLVINGWNLAGTGAAGRTLTMYVTNPSSSPYVIYVVGWVNRIS